MTDQPAPRNTRRTTVIIIAVLVIVIAAVAVIGLLAANGSPTPAPTSSARTSVPAGPTATPSTASTTPGASPSVSSAPATASTPQPTKTASIASSAPIAKSLTAEVTKSESVQGKAEGPGEIAGPAVRFTIAIKNSTGKRVNLSNTVVNVYYGKQSTPATQLQEPGGSPFPQSVATGDSARGIFVFTIPKDQRSIVVVTVDTSVNNPVVAFRGSAPK